MGSFLLSWIRIQIRIPNSESGSGSETLVRAHTGPFGVFQGLAYFFHSTYSKRVGGGGYSLCGYWCHLVPPPSWQHKRLSFSSPMPDGKRHHHLHLHYKSKHCKNIFLCHFLVGLKVPKHENFRFIFLQGSANYGQNFFLFWKRFKAC